MTLYARFAAHIDQILDRLVAAGSLPDGLGRGGVTVEPPRDPADDGSGTRRGHLRVLPNLP